MSRISASLTHPDRELAVVEAKFGPGALMLVDDAIIDAPAISLERAVGDAAKNTPDLTLDLISHSANGVLIFRSWRVDNTDPTAGKLKQAWGQSVTTIRLLGCNTAATDDGKAAMRFLASVFQVLVLGTSCPIYANDFGSTGFTRDDLLVAESDLTNVSLHLDKTTIDAWFARFIPYATHDLDTIVTDLKHETLADIAATQHAYGTSWPVHLFTANSFGFLFKHVQRNAASAPGLLAVPDSEAIAEVSPGLYQRVTYLLGGAFMRVYTNAEPDGLILRRSGPGQIVGGNPIILPG